VEHGPQNVLRGNYGLDAAAIVKAALMMADSRRQERVASKERNPKRTLSSC
jgi:hypothetical protein